MSRRSRIIRRLVVTIALISTAGVVILLPPPWQADDIREAVFRHLFSHNSSGLQYHADAYYLAVGPFERDPSDRFIRRFQNHRPVVRKVSECRMPANHDDRPRSLLTGRQGLVFRVTFVRRVGIREFEVKGGYYEGGMSGSGNTYRVRLVDGRWRIVQDRMDWIS